jgi:hypothetical protein
VGTFLTATIVLAAIVQAVSAVAIALLTKRLVSATNQYTEATSDSLKLSREELKLNREEFERDWRPDLRIAEIQGAEFGGVSLRVANLAKPAALVTRLKIGTGGCSHENRTPQSVESYPLPLLVPGGQIIEQFWIESKLEEYRLVHGPGLDGMSSWESALNISLIYVCAGRENETPWLDCTITFRGRGVHSVLSDVAK